MNNSNLYYLNFDNNKKLLTPLGIFFTAECLIFKKFFSRFVNYRGLLKFGRTRPLAQLKSARMSVIRLMHMGVELGPRR